jgi:hypothetical protein
MGSCCNKSKELWKANALSDIELTFLSKVSLNFKDDKMKEDFKKYRNTLLMYWALYITFWGTIHQIW